MGTSMSNLVLIPIIFGVFFRQIRNYKLLLV